MDVYQVRIKLYLLKNLKVDDVQSSLTRFINGAFEMNKQLPGYHQASKYKNYVFDGLFPFEINQEYKADQIYTFTVRTVDRQLANFFATTLINYSNSDFKALTGEMKFIAKKQIEKVFSITPCVIKDYRGYWKDNMSLEEFENKIKINLIKKYNHLTGSEMNGDFPLFVTTTIKNKVPISVKYKNKKLLGDKIESSVSEDKHAQELLYMALGTGILENNGRGFGFINFRYL